MIKTLIIDDSEETRELLKTILEKETNLIIYEASSIKNALEIFDIEKPSIILLDMHLPDGNGSILCEKLRKSPEKYGDPFIIAITADISQDSVNKNLELGCDDYIKKPFNQKEFLIRFKKIAKRVPGEKKIITHKNISINLEKGHVTYDSEDVILSKNEFKMLLFFVINKGILLNREKIMDYVWNDNFNITDRAVDQCLKRLRKKIPILNELIISKRGFGYLLK